MGLQMERLMTKIAEGTGRPSIIVFDRGLMDAKGYISESDWKRVLEKFGGGDSGKTSGVTEEYLLQRYDAVIHLVTAADGAEQFYKCGKTVDDSGHVVIRNETAEQARALDNKMQEIWKAHRRHVVIPNTDSFAAKLESVSGKHLIKDGIIEARS